MSVLVKGMEMPESCKYCNFRVVSECFDDYCAAIEALRYIDTHNGSRQDWCPLVEVPAPHGRLIEDTPTIIPADNEAAMRMERDES